MIQSSDVFTRKWLLLTSLCFIPIFSVFAFVGDPGRGRAAGIVAAVLMTAVRANWSCKAYTWFWAIAAVMMTLHVVLIFRIAWTAQSYPGYTLLPFALLDYGVVYGSFKLAENLVKRRD